MTKKTLFDDTFFSVTVEDESFKLLHLYEFNECLEILLTNKQMNDFVVSETKRMFWISESRIKKFENYLESNDNVWRKQHKNKNNAQN